MKNRREVAALVLLGLLYFFLRTVSLSREPINAVFDEGVHLGLIKLTAEGRGSLYRDFLFVHPPGVIWAGAWLWKHGVQEIFTLRLIYITVCGAALFPFYGLVKRRYGVRTALYSLGLLIVTPGFAAWLARTIMLDLALQIPLCLALWAIARSEKPSPASLLGAGLLIGLAALIKAMALPIAIALAASLFLVSKQKSSGHFETRRADPSFRHAWLLFGLGFAAAFGTITLLLWRTQNYGFFAYGLNGSVSFNGRQRPYELASGFYMLPLQMTLGLSGVWRMTFGSKNASERFLGAFALLYTVLILLLPRNFYWRYLIPSLPVYTLGVVLWLQSLPDQPAWKRRLSVFALIVGSLVALTSEAVYLGKDAVNPPEYRQALAVLKASAKPLFTLDPIWVVSSKQEFPLWLFACDAEWKIPQVKVPQDFNAVLGRCPTVLLDRKTLEMLPPETLALIRRDYRPVFRFLSPSERRYVEILRR